MSAVMITGINGFVGNHLAREMHQAGFRVIGVGYDRDLRADRTDVVDTYIACDLTNPEEVGELHFDEVTAVINLAGLANLGASFDDPEQYMRVNTAILRNICEALRKAGRSSVRVLAISTGAVYDPEQPLPLVEDSKLVQADKTSPYVTSKQRMEEIAGEEREKGSDCVVVRPFNHIGPGQESGFLLPDLAAQVHEALSNGGGITVGNLDTKRDYTDVRDVARAYRILATAPALRHTVYNVCSGKPVPGKKILEELLGQMDARGLSVQVDQSKIRPHDPLELYGSAGRLESELGWSPEIPLETTVRDFLTQQSS